jgi:LAO/AO transport system kinase
MPHDIPQLAAGVIAQDRRALAKAITLVESARADHRELALHLLSILPKTHQALRLGLSGTPGVGKSTLIETFGLMLISMGLRVAVLAVDPSSARTGGSILGDKTRMEQLSRQSAAFIRPSPSQSQMGGVARRTREAVALCEAAAYDVVLIETVGVGQSETVVSQICDVFVLLLAPAGGDELQGVKRGIMEMADLILVNKADGDMLPAAMRTRADYAGALQLLRRRPQDPEGYPSAMTVSALTQSGLSEAWERIQALVAWRKANGHWDYHRAEQARHWFIEEIRQSLLAGIHHQPLRGLIQILGDQVASGTLSPDVAAQQVLAALGRKE